MVAGLLVELKTLDEPEKKGIAGWFAKANKSIEETKAKYSIAEKNVDKIAGELENHKLKLMKDVEILDQMYDRNLDYFKEADDVYPCRQAEAGRHAEHRAEGPA